MHIKRIPSFSFANYRPTNRAPLSLFLLKEKTNRIKNKQSRCIFVGGSMHGGVACC